MAQEARLNLRMQRELKLLLTDPPHGASFPSLTSSSSLSSIHAQIEGPEGTVYANGFFKLKIQIPERYPFQPPIVTFVTPIYHPNIDNGGRICLDILNLPPKGAWQPSLNISTVITSIGLLLSEPNPDDGLMHDVSTEYKYNRQAFDQKARSMTQKYAKAEGSNGCYDQEIQNLTDSREGLVEAKESTLPNAEVPDHFVNQKRLFGLSRKLSLDSAGHGQRHSGGTANEVPLGHAFNKQMEAGEVKPVTNEPTECNLNQDKVQQSTKNLSPELVSPSEVRIGGKKDFMVQTQCSTWLEPQSVLLNNADTLPLPQAERCSTANPNNSDMRNFSTNESAKKLQLKPTGVGQKSEELEKLHIKPELSPQLQFAASCQTFSLSETPHHNNNPHKNAADQNRNGFSTRHKKLGLTGRKHSFGTSSSSQSKQKDNKENLAPSQNLPLSNSDTRVDTTSSLIFPSESDDTCDGWTKKSSNPCGTSTKLPLLAVEQFGENKDKSVQSDFQSGKPSALQVNHRLPCEDLFDNRQHKLLNKEKELEYNRNIKHQEKGSPKCEAAIVLDSEDSEDERILHKRSKLSLARRRIPGKRKA